MNEIKVNFYDEQVLLKTPINFPKFKEVIADTFSMDPVDVEELIVCYLHGEDKISIMSEIDYKKALVYSISNKASLDIFLEVSEKSKLYQREFQQSRLEIQEKSETQKKQEELKKEIMEKERQLKEILAKEEEERKRRVEEKQREKERLEQEEKLRKEEEERARQIFEEGRKKAEEKEKLRDQITEAVSQVVNSNIESLRSELIEKTILSTSRVVEKMMENPESHTKINQTVHEGVSCDGCGMFPLIGLRYKCTECYNFDFCEECEEKNAETHAHPFIKFRQPNNGWRRGRPHRGQFWKKFGKCPRFNEENLGQNFKEKCGEKFEKCKEFLKDLPTKCPKFENFQTSDGGFLDFVKNQWCNIFGGEKVEETKPACDDKIKIEDVKPEENSFLAQLVQMKEEFLINKSDNEILSALKEANGDIDTALTLLF
jgi:hypothetical protein